MAIIASNSLAGTDGVQPTLTTLGQTGDAPAVLDNTLLEYDNAYTVHGYNTLRMTSNYARHDTGRLTFDLPASGPWSVRFWVRPEPLSDPYDMQEYRHLFTIGTSTLVMRESAGRNIVTRLQPEDLAAANSAGTESGSAVTFDQLLRYEITFDGVDQLESSVYAGDSTTGARINTWTHTPDDDQFVLSGFRWRKYTTLQSGDTDASTGGLVTPYQEKLLVWDPNSLPMFGADGDYGGETVSATEDFQTERGLLVDGIAGPETQSALDLVVALDSDPNDYPIPLWLGGLTITDTGAAIGPLDEIDASVSAAVSVDGAVVAEDTTTVAHGDVSVSGDVSVTTAVSVAEDGPVTVAGDVSVFKATSADPADADVAVSGSVVVTAESLIPPPPPIPPQVHLAVYSPAGGFLGYLPNTFQWEASMPLNDVGGMTLSYSALAPGTDIIDSFSVSASVAPFEIALHFFPTPESNPIEPPHCRFISLRRRRDRADRTQTISWTLANYGWMLRKGKMSQFMVNNERVYTDVLAGEPLSDVIDEETPITFTDLPITFTSALDSDGNAWDHDPFDITYPAGVDPLAMVESFADQGLVDWRFDGREFQVYNASTSMFIDRTDHVLRLNGVAQEAIEDFAMDDFARRVQAVYGNSQLVQEAALSFGWGRWKDLINLTGDMDLDSATQAVQNRLNTTSFARVQETRRYYVDNNQPIPMIDYLPGDQVSVEDEFGASTLRETRVHQITLTHGADRILRSQITIGDRFIDSSVKGARKIDATTNRASKILGAGTGRNLL